MEIKKLISFDFDDTLVHTTLPDEGKKIWKEKTGEDWPHRGWWSKPESLDMEIFDIPLNKKIYRRYKQAISDPDNYVILATGRVAPLQDEVDIILNHYGLEFDEMHLNPGIDTFEFKSNLFEKLINELEPEEFIMYDDRQEHLIRFVEWANAMSCKVTLIDAISGEEFKPNEDKNLQEHIRRVLREEVKTKSTNKEFSKYKDSKFNTLRGYTLQDIVDNWDTLSNHKNDNIQTIKYFIDNPDKIDELIYDDKGLEDGYHRLIATKILKKPRFKYKLKDEEISEIKEGELTEKCWKGYTQKGMKTMFGKRYPNCVKNTKK